MSKFKIGDRVVIILPYTEQKVVYTISHYDTYYSLLETEFAWSEEELELESIWNSPLWKALRED